VVLPKLYKIKLVTLTSIRELRLEIYPQQSEKADIYTIDCYKT